MDCSLKCCCGTATFPTTCWQRGMWLACMQTIHCRIYARYDTWFTSQIRVPLLHILFTFCSFTPAAQLTRHSICWPCIAAHTCIILHWSKYEACDTWFDFTNMSPTASHFILNTCCPAQSTNRLFLLAMQSYTHTHTHMYNTTVKQIWGLIPVQIRIPLFCIPFSSHLLPSRSIHHLFLLAIHTYTNYTHTHIHVQLQLQNL